MANSFLNKEGFQHFIKSLKIKLEQKADISSIPIKISELENDEDYIDSNTVDSKITSAVSKITSFDFQVVTTLPSQGEKGIIYLISHDHGIDDFYDEYIWIDDRFEKIGSADIDLSEYAKKTDVNSFAEVIDKKIDSLEQELSTETETRTTSDDDLDKKIKEEITARKSDSQILEKSINTEITNRISSDEEIKLSLATENEARTRADASLENSLLEEVNARIVFDDNLQTLVSAVDKRVDVLKQELTAEGEARKNADETLESSISAEETTRANMDAAILETLAKEIQSREDADSDLLSKITSIPKFEISVVEELPTADISDTTVYLLKTSETETGNLYTEYIHVKGEWEKLGAQTVDLSDYYQKKETNDLLAKKAEVKHEHVIADISDYSPYDDTEVRELISAESTARSEADAKKVGYQEVQGNTLYMYTDDTKAVLLATLELPTAPVQDVQVAGTSVLSDGVANVPLATSSIAGAIYSNTNQYNIGVSGAGYAYVANRDLSYYQNSMGVNHAISKGILENIKQDYVDSILCSSDESQALTTEQKINARNRIGVRHEELIETITVSDDTTSVISREVEPNGNPYEFAELSVTWMVPNTSSVTGNISCIFSFVNSGSKRQGIGSGISTNSTRYSGVYWDGANYNRYSNSTSDAYLYAGTFANKNYFNIEKNDIVNGITIQSSSDGVYFPSGTKVYIYGIRA